MAQRLGDRVRFGRYEALLRLGAGGMAEVFAARLTGEAGFSKLVAVKRMLPHLLEDDALVDRFFDEARLAAHVSSPHVVRTIDVGRSEDGAPYIVLELVVGVAFSELLRRQARGAAPLPLAAVLELLAQVADGLADAHDARTPDGRALALVHRDVSPHNLLVGADGRARLADFGIAYALERRARTATGRVLGKLAYMSPEQVRADAVDARSDVFSLGAIAWEALTGRRLFTAKAPDETVAQVLRMPIPRVDDVRRGIPPAVTEAVARALLRDRDERLASAAELARGLREGGRALGEPPDATILAGYVAETGGGALREVQHRIGIAARESTEPAEDVTRTLTGLEGTVNVSGEETFSSGGGATISLGTEEVISSGGDATIRTPLARPWPLLRVWVPLALLVLAVGIALGAWLGGTEAGP